MTNKRILAVALMFVAATIFTLALSAFRVGYAEKLNSSVAYEIQNRYGNEHVIMMPEAKFFVKTVTNVESIYDSETGKNKQVKKTHNVFESVKMATSTVEVTLTGIEDTISNITYPAYTISYKGEYTFTNERDAQSSIYRIYHSLPAQNTVYNDVLLRVNGKAIKNIDSFLSEGYIERTLRPGEHLTFSLTYTTTGTKSFFYNFTYNNNNAQIKNFFLTLTTDIERAQPASSTLRAQSVVTNEKGVTFKWDMANTTITAKNIGVTVPEEEEGNIIAGKMSLFSPFSILFYVFILIILSVLLKVDIHPMNYLFVITGFISFILILLFFTPHIGIGYSFPIASVISVAMVSSYLVLFTPKKIALFYSIVAQLIYLVGFSFSFFFEEVIGVIVTVVIIVTLFILMQATGRIKWEEVFQGKRS